MRHKERVGYLAAFFTTGSFLPGAINVWWNRPAPASSVSFPMFTMMTFGLAIWVVYGIMHEKKSVVWANVVALPFAIAVLVYKLLYG